MSNKNVTYVIGSSRNKVLILYEKQKKRCYYCKIKLLAEAKEGRPPHLDHRIPKSIGGDYGKNIVLSCEWCDNKKGTSHHATFEKFVGPYVNGRVEQKEDLNDYWEYLKLKRKFRKKRK